MIKVVREEPAEPLVTITTTEYGAEFIANCLRQYARYTSSLKEDVRDATSRAAIAISPYIFNYDSDKISKLFQ